jgi:hypothetical protein
MDLFRLYIDDPDDEDVFSYTAETPPSISMSGYSLASELGELTFKWFSTNPKVGSDFGGTDISAFFDAHLNIGLESYASSTAWSFVEARVGTQWISYTCLDQSVLTAGDDVETKLAAVTRNGLQGGKTTLTNPVVTPLKIHVIGAVIIEPDIGTTSIFVGGLCRVESTFTSPPKTGVDWPTDTDDELRYWLESKSIGTTVWDTEWRSDVDLLTYDVSTSGVSNYKDTPMLGDYVTQSDGTTKDYRLNVSYDTYNRTKQFQITVSV